MDNEKNNDQLREDWFDTLLSPGEQAQEIGTDEQAVSAHGMSDIADMELDKIIQEALSERWDSDVMDDAFLPDPIEEVSAPSEDPLYTDGAVLPEPEERDDAVERKVRPRRKNGYGLLGLPHLLSTAIWLVLCLAIGVSLGRLVWLCAADVLAFGRQDKDVVITITAADDLDSITDKLYDAGLIKYPGLFKLYAQLANVEEEEKISTGTFTLNTLYDYHALVGGMSSTSSYRETIEVMIPEGYTCAQIFALLEEQGVCAAEDLEAYCMESQFSSYWFLEDVEKGTKYCLEGFLFPDTYQFYTNSSAKQVFIKLLEGFENHFTEEMQAQLETLNETLAAKYRSNGLSQEYIDAHKLTVKDIVTIASMIEKETAYSGESPIIASVIYNRLTNPGNYPKLNIDATIVYALGGKTELTTEDLQYDSPYNTYLYEGLPPGAISNPGSYSLKAALNPSETNYYFYALDTSGEAKVHKFFVTYAEHQAFVNG